MKLIFRIICLMILCWDCRGSRPTAEFPVEVIDMGMIRENLQIDTFFEVRNAGSYPLEIAAAIPAYRDMEVTLPHKVVQPGKNVRIGLKVNTAVIKGPFSWRLLVYIAGEKYPHSLEIKGQKKDRPRFWDTDDNGVAYEKTTVQWGRVFYGTVATDTIRVVNRSAGIRSFEFGTLKDYLQFCACPEQLLPGDTGMIIVSLLTGKLARYGEFFEYAHWRDRKKKGGQEYKLFLSANVVEDFSVLSADEKCKAPRLFVAEHKHDFGKIPAEQKVKWETRIQNKGESNLIIRNIKTGCGCTAVTTGKRIIPPGKSEILEVIFNPSGRRGQQQKTITLVSNDYRNPEQVLVIRAVVEEKE